jgi:hypothetical protein
MSSPNFLGPLLSYEVHRLEIKGRHYILLPKLNRRQLAVLKDHFAVSGFSVRGTTSLVARSPEIAIHVEASGLCWSSSDPSDYVLPPLPELLGMKRERLDFEELVGLYLRIDSGSRRLAVKVVSRIESLGNWYALRSSGMCGLAPDECLVIRSVLRRSRGKCTAITDFAADESTPFVLGHRLYYLSELPVAHLADTLRVVGERGGRNSYLPRDGVLSLSYSTLLEREFTDSFDELGEWCSFATR